MSKANRRGVASASHTRAGAGSSSRNRHHMHDALRMAYTNLRLLRKALLELLRIILILWTIRAIVVFELP